MPGFVAVNLAQSVPRTSSGQPRRGIGRTDIDRITAIWREALNAYGGPYLFGARPTLADAMYAPVVTRFRTYGVKLDSDSEAYCTAVMAHPAMKEWIDAAKHEPWLIASAELG